MAYSEDTSGQVQERFVERARVRTVTGTTDTLSLADRDGFIVATAAGAVTITIPATSVAAFPVGTVITVFAAGAGGVTIAKTGTDVLNGTATAAQNLTRKIVKTGESAGVSTWYAFV